MDSLVLSSIILVVLAPILLVIVPWRMRNPPTDSTPVGKIDERDTVFSRIALKPATDRYLDYYKRNPEYRHIDESLRAKAAFLSDDAKQTDPLSSAAASATFATVGALRNRVDGAPAEKRVVLRADEASQYVKDFCTYLASARK